ncbi:NUDIX hydrolase [Azospirillum halopraeferens]|uniref:NUDIX hydrolase n=1 Tax=Azospirillum halopraeferens TaxID=34010 RepID=UPI0003FD2FF9|nr:NUDIX hydrolase [Azospirillum halopraeferens]
MTGERKTLEPWTVLHSRDVYTHEPWLKIRVEALELPDGRRVEFHQVDAPAFVIIVPETADGRFVVLRQYKHGARRVNVNFPAGTLDAGETPLACARRELLEETGCEAEAWTDLGAYATMGNLRGNLCHLFLARGCRTVAEPDSGDLEEMRVETMTRGELLAAVAAGDFAIASQVAALGAALNPDLADALARGAGASAGGGREGA